MLTSGSMEFKSQQDIDKMSADELKNYVFVHSGWIEKAGMSFYAFNVDYLNAKNEHQNVFELDYIPDKEIADADFVFFAKTLNNTKEISNKYEKYSDSHVLEENLPVIKSKTLLLDEAMTELDSADLVKDYEYKAKIVSDETIAKAITDQNPDYLFIKMIFSRGTHYPMYDVFDAQTMKIVSALGMGGVTVKLAPGEGRYTGSGGSSAFYDRNQYPYYEMGTANTLSSITLWKSKLKIKKSQLRYIDSKLAQKLNFK
jgi:hypothetical protein